MLKLIAFAVPCVGITAAANWAAIYGTIQALSLIPASLHWLVAAIGFIMLIPFNLAVVTIAFGIGLFFYALLDSIDSK